MSKIKLFDTIGNAVGNKWREYKALDRRSKARWWGEFLVKNAIYLIIIALIIYVEIDGASKGKKSLLAPAGIADILQRAGSAMFLALGVGGIIVLTGTDLSAGRIMGLTACISASLLQKPVAEYAWKMWPNLKAPPWIFVLLLVMAIGAAFGAFNGFFVAKFKLHPFIVTLGTQLILYGTVLWYLTLGNNGGNAVSGLTDTYKDVVKGRFSFVTQITGAAIPYYVYYAIIAIIIMWFVWNRTTLGKNMYAVGANPEAANVSGISVMATTILIFTIAGCLYGFSGFIESAVTASNTASTGLNAELNAIAACVIGGVSFTGGTGKISGIVIGVILLQIVDIALVRLGVSGEITNMIKGAIILIAVAIDMRKYLTRK